MNTTELSRWFDHLRHIARPFADPSVELGLGPLGPAFLAAVDPTHPTPPHTPDEKAEISLWRARTDLETDIQGIISTPTEGSLLPHSLYETIEVWTDAELSAIHALWWLARDRDQSQWMNLVERARDWHILNTQPDNATNRPWALHVFLLGPTLECRHYAETLLHNCMIFNGRPDPLSALILLDSANAIETAIEK